MAFDDEISKVRSANEGSRNDQLFKSAAALKEICNSSWAAPFITEQEIEIALLDATSLQYKEAQRTIASAFKTATGTREELKSIVSISAIDSPPPMPLPPLPENVQLIGKVAAPSNPVTKQHLPLTDLGNAERLVRLHGESIRFCSDNGFWYVWDGHRWKNNHRLMIMNLVHDAIRKIVYESDDAELSKEARKKIVNHAFASENGSRMDAMLKHARPMVEVLATDFDAHPMLLNVANGIVDLKTGQLLPPNPKLLLSQMANVEFDPNAQCPQWIEFVKWCFKNDQDLIAFVQKGIGYSIAGEIREQNFFVLYGNSDNGKSTFMNTVRLILGDYGYEASHTLVIKQRHDGHPTELAALKGKRVVVASETNKNAPLNIQRMKELTNKTMSARFMRGNFFEFLQTHTIWIDTNHRPVIKDPNDDAIWKRVKPVPFLNKIARKDRDLALEDKLLAEASGILNWLIDGCIAYQREGLTEPSIVVSAKQEYKGEHDMIGAFLDECCNASNPNSIVPTTVLFKAYQEWCIANNEHAVSNRVFGKEIKARGFEAKKSHNVRQFKGIELHQNGVHRGTSTGTTNYQPNDSQTVVNKGSTHRGTSGYIVANNSEKKSPHDEELSAMMYPDVPHLSNANDDKPFEENLEKNGGQQGYDKKVFLSEIITEDDGAFLARAVDRHCKTNGAIDDHKALEIRKDYKELYLESPAAANEWLSELTGEPYPSATPPPTISSNAQKVKEWCVQKFGKSGNGYATRSVLKNSLGLNDEDIESLIAQRIVKACDNPDYLSLIT